MQVMQLVKPGRAPRVPFALLVGGLVVGSLVLLLVLNTASAANELERHGLARKDADVAAKLQDLHERAARSAAPENLARAAADLGMVPAGNPAFVVVGPNGATVLGKPKQATAAPVVVPKKPKAVPTRTTTAAATTAPATTPAVTTAPTTGSPAPGRTPTATTPVAPATPTSTPTPEITLPGGVR